MFPAGARSIQMLVLIVARQLHSRTRGSFAGDSWTFLTATECEDAALLQEEEMNVRGCLGTREDTWRLKKGIGTQLLGESRKYRERCFV
jgi:hypothetical protein